MITYNHASIFFLIALIIPFSTSTPLSQRGLGIHVSGRLCCTGSGTCRSRGNLCGRAPGNLPSPGLSNVLVSLKCDGGEYTTSFVAVGQNVTDVNGRFEIIERDVPAVNLTQEEPPCAIWVRFPVTDLNCPALSGAIWNGFLVGIIKFYGIKRAPFGFVKEGKVSTILRSPKV